MEAAAASNEYVDLAPGDPAPWIRQRSTSSDNYAIDSAAGRYLVLAFYASAGDDAGRAAVDFVLAHREIFDDVRMSCFGVSVDAADQAEGRVAESVPGLRFFWDFDLRLSTAYGAAPRRAKAGAPARLRRFWLVLDPRLRVLRRFALGDTDALLGYLAGLPPVGTVAGIELQAPILFLPEVFSPDLCAKLIRSYETAGGESSGFMRDVGGRTVVVNDPRHKVRHDHLVETPELVDAIRSAISRRVIPEIRKIHCFEVTRMERYLVGCYSASDGGHFRPHRDNTTTATAHRRFAVSINLNADFEGGELSFPEYGPRSFKPPVGGAVVFSCSLLHAVSRVTAGRRFAFLPFLYDDAAAAIREKNAEKAATAA